MLCRFEVLSVPSADTAAVPIIALSFDDKAYLFNCGESAQRSVASAKLHPKRIQEIFLTSGWESHGGVAGMLHELSRVSGKLQLGLHGPKNLAYYLASLRAGHQRDFRSMTAMDLVIQEYGDALPPKFEDHNVTIQPILALPDRLRKTDTDSLAVDKTSEILQTSEAYELDRKRIYEVAHCVWSGEFLENKDGEWVPIKLSRELPQPPPKVTPLKRGFATIDAPAQVESLATQRSLFPPMLARDFRPTHSQQLAFHTFMSGDLPDICTDFPAAVSYLVQGKSRPGKFDPVRAKALGVQPGPQFGRLYQGHPVITDDQKTIYPEDVMGPPRPCPAVLMVNCPSIEYISDFCSNPFWKSCDAEKRPQAIIHSCSAAVLEDDRYIEWMTSFGEDVKHLTSCSDNDGPGPLSHIKSDKFLKEMRHLSTEHYMPHSVSEYAEPYAIKHLELGIAISRLHSALKLDPFPQLTFTTTEPPSLGPVNEAHAALLRRYEGECATVQKKIADLESKRSPSDIDPHLEVVTLGTGSAGPSQYRNTASIILLDSGKDGFSTLLDCGEGTTGQIRRAFGHEAGAVMQSLRIVYVSHLHADHHLGLIGVIKYWLMHNQGKEHKLNIVCPPVLGRSVLEYGNVDGDLQRQMHRLRIVNSLHVIDDYQNNPENRGSLSMQAIADMKTDLPGLYDIRTIDAVHCPKATCVRLDHKRGWSVAYTGDARPMSKFSALAHGVTCMIHEATFEDDLLNEAVKKRHSTVSEALEISLDSEAQTTLLTHFSQRYYRVPKLSPEQIATLSDRQVGVAVDFMRVKVKDIWKLGHHVLPQRNLNSGLVRMNIKDEVAESTTVMFDDV